MNGVALFEFNVSLITPSRLWFDKLVDFHIEARHLDFYIWVHRLFRGNVNALLK